MISVQKLRKTYKENNKTIVALDDVSLEVNSSELFGFIGPDGAGKTSLFRILATLLLPDSGTATIKNLEVTQNISKIRNIIGYMPGKFSLYQDLSIEENLNFFADIFGTSVKENYDLIKDIYIQIEPFKKRRAGKLSGGMKQKLALCCALIHKPEILLLDEPTTGVDPVSRKEFWDILKKLKQQNITILVSTPYMDEAGMCDRIALVQAGKILGIDSPQNIIDKNAEKLYQIKAQNNYYLLNKLRENPQTESCYMFGEYIHATFLGDELPQYPEILELQKIKPGIEDVFINLMTNK